MNEVILYSPKYRLRATIIPYFGANVRSLQWQNAQNEWIDLLDGYTQKSDLEAHTYFKNSKLAPFANRVAAGQYIFEGQTYQLPINETLRQHALHGFVWQMPFEIVAQNSHSDTPFIDLKMRYDPSDKSINSNNSYYKGYPFSFELYITYRISEKGFSCQTNLLNIGKQTLPYTDGWHPYFKLNTPTINTCSLELPPVAQILTNENLIPNGKFAIFAAYAQPTIIDNALFDTGFFLLNSHSRGVDEVIHTTSIYDSNNAIKLTLWQNNAYPYLQIYTPPHRQSIAIEPMSGAANAFNNGQGLLVLASGKHWQGEYGVLMKQDK